MAIPEKIKKLAHQVRTAIYGKEVRESIAESMEITANVADEAKVTANEAKEVTQQLIDGSFDTGELNTNIEERLNNLEKEYAPRLSEAEKGISDNRKYIDEQLDAQQLEIEEVVNKIERTKLVDLEEPLYICHRGGANIFPENTLEAYKGCLAVGNPFIEMDVQTLADGSLGVMHDFTVDRTTDKNGNVSHYSAMGFRNLNVDILPGYKNVNAPLFEDIVSAFGKSAIYCPESKDKKSVKKIVDTIEKYDLKEYALVQSVDMNELQYAVSKGYQVLLLTSSVPPETLLDNGIGYIGVSKTAVTDQYIQSCVSNGIKVIVFTVNNRYERDLFLEKGVSGFFTDEPFYLSDAVDPLSRDPFNNQVFYHGMVKALTNRGEFADGNRWGFLNTIDSSFPNDGRDFVLQGWAGELPETFVLEFDFKYTNHVTGGWLATQICTKNDFFDDFGSLSTGYNIILANNGNIDVYRNINGTSTRLDSLINGGTVGNNIIPVKIEVNPTTITITRKDTGISKIVSDSSYRGGYLHFGRKWSGGTFGNIVIS